MNKKLVRLLSSIIILGLLTSGCVIRSKEQNDAVLNQGVFLPPTVAPTLIPTITPTPTPIIPTQPANCMSLLTFLSDQTVPDGTVFSPGDTIDKRWLVENSGDCHWNETYELRLVTGADLGVDPTQPLPPTLSGEQAIIQILFIAPSEPGSYQSAWQAYTGSGMPFGDVFYVDIAVE
jgi:hypothetical protein